MKSEWKALNIGPESMFSCVNTLIWNWWRSPSSLRAFSRPAPMPLVKRGAHHEGVCFTWIRGRISDFSWKRLEIEILATQTLRKKRRWLGLCDRHCERYLVSINLFHFGQECDQINCVSRQEVVIGLEKRGKRKKISCAEENGEGSW